MGSGRREVDATRYKVAARKGRDAAAAGDTTEAVARFEEALIALARNSRIARRPARRRPRRRVGSRAMPPWSRTGPMRCLRRVRAAEIIGELEAAVADAPLRERRWGQLMLALYRAGRQGEALGAYQRARSLLADELGVDPGPNFAVSRAAIVAQDAALDTPVSQQASSVTRAVTFLLTDIEGSTAAWEADADAMAVATRAPRRARRAGRDVPRRTAHQDARRRRRHVLGLRPAVGGSRRSHRAAGSDPPRAMDTARADAHPRGVAHR